MRVCDESGYADCFTCGKRKHWKEVDAGHFITRSKYATRWNPANVQFQCKGCNRFGGKPVEFMLALEKQYGHGIAEELLIESNRSARYSNEDLLRMIALYTKASSELEGFVG